MKKIYVSILLIVIVGIVTFLGTLNNDIINKDATVILIIKTSGFKEEYEVPITGNSLYLLQQISNVTMKRTFYSQVIKCINDICEEGPLGWFFYVNGKPPAFGPQDYIPKENDILEFRYSYK